MASNNFHIIGKQVFDLVFNQVEDAYGLEGLVSRLSRERLTEAMEAVFDEMVPANQLVRLDKLQLDIGELDAQELEGRLVELIVRALREELKRVLPSRDGNRNEMPQTAILDHWFHFLKTGTKPWNAAALSDDAWEWEILLALEKQKEKVAVLRRLLGAEITVLRRLVFQHQENFLESIAGRFTGRKMDGLAMRRERMENILVKIFEKTEERGTSDFIKSVFAKKYFWLFIFKKIEDKKMAGGAPVIMRIFFSAVLGERVIFQLLKTIEKSKIEKRDKLSLIKEFFEVLDLKYEEKGGAVLFEWEKEKVLLFGGEKRGEKKIGRDLMEKRGEVRSDFNDNEKSKEGVEEEEKKKKGLFEKEIKKEKKGQEEEHGRPEEKGGQVTIAEVLGEKSRGVADMEEEKIKPVGSADGQGFKEMAEKEKWELGGAGKNVGLDEEQKRSVNTQSKIEGRETGKNGGEENKKTGRAGEVRKDEKDTKNIVQSDKREGVKEMEAESSMGLSERKSQSTFGQLKSRGGRPDKTELEKEAKKEEAEKSGQGKDNPGIVFQEKEKEGVAGFLNKLELNKNNKTEKDADEHSFENDEKKIINLKIEGDANLLKKEKGGFALERDENKSVPDVLKEKKGIRSGKSGEITSDFSDEIVEQEGGKINKKEWQEETNGKEGEDVFGTEIKGGKKGISPTTTYSDEQLNMGWQVGKKQQEGSFDQQTKLEGSEKEETPNSSTTPSQTEQSQVKSTDWLEAAKKKYQDWWESLYGHQSGSKEVAMNSNWYVQGAGLVLLHPFLSMFFKELGLLEGNEFKDEPARHRAVHLLQYLLTGATNAPEHELLLPKFLCDLPFEIPIELDVELAEAEQVECNNLLEAVIRNWGALGDSSPGALREGFLQRDGKLEKRESGWHLLVEQKTIDILLERLPWNISIIRLPWREGLLKVEWA